MECYSSTLNLWFGDIWDNPWWADWYWDEEEDKMVINKAWSEVFKNVPEPKVLEIVIHKDRMGPKSNIPESMIVTRRY